MDFPSCHPGHSRRSVGNVDKFSGTNLSSPHPGKFEIYPSAVEGPLPAISFPPRHLPFHGAALPTLLQLHFPRLTGSVRSPSYMGSSISSMKLYNQSLSISPTDLSYFLSCRHRAAKELGHTYGARKRPMRSSAVIDTLIEMGIQHEAQYVKSLEESGRSVLDLNGVKNQELSVQRTLEGMKAGVDAIVQAGLASEGWHGRPDVLLKVPRKSPILGDWSYEPADAKLARETRGGTIIQLGVYCHLLELAQGCLPELFHVVSPGADGQVTRTYRFHDYAAYFRFIKTSFEESIPMGFEKLEALHEPDPVDHCTVCPWWGQCRDWWVETDHLSLVAGVSRLQRQELLSQGISTLENLAKAGTPFPFKPYRGNICSYERIRDQARVQLQSREENRIVYELITPAHPSDDNEFEPMGLARLPEPSPGDVFLDLEGDSLASDGGRDYLFGLVTVEKDGTENYQGWWAKKPAEERAAFETTVDYLMDRLEAFPGMHIYHYAPYEVTAFKRLMGRYATREQEVDRLLRGLRFVDLYAVVRQGLRVGVERYSIKELEPLYEIQRQVDLRDASRALGKIEQALELGRQDLTTKELCDVVEGYNKDDCVSTRRLRDWLEDRRMDLLAAGATIKRPPQPPDEAPEALDARAQAVEEVRSRLIAGVPDDPQERSLDQQASFQLAFMLDWHRREAKSGWWEYFRLLSLPEDELMEERKAVSQLTFQGEIGKRKKSVVHRYHYPSQDFDIEPGGQPKTLDGKSFGEILSNDPETGTLDIKVGPTRKDERPTALIIHNNVRTQVQEDALLELGRQAADAGGVTSLPKGPQRALLLREPPRLASGDSFSPPSRHSDATVTDYAVSVVTQLDQSLLAIQGPPGAGKTYTGARMIAVAVKAGLKIGVTATSHKVINNLLKAVSDAAEADTAQLIIGHKTSSDPTKAPTAPGVTLYKSYPKARKDLDDGSLSVLGGTSWLWARPQFRESVDILFVDEAGQVSLANVLAIAGAAKSLVLLGDPQQLEQPSKGTHPEGTGLSALQHILGDAETMPPDRGLFLPTTWRLAPPICDFTSELFYAGELRPKNGLEEQLLVGGPCPGSGLWLCEVCHEGNTSTSEEEAAEVTRLVEELLKPGVSWRDEAGQERPVRPEDIRIMAPFNAQVQRIQDHLARASLGAVPTGTVDKFQGQEAPVSIYSMATSRPEDAPRGMEFLYSLNRLNVATSRARCSAIVVASPRLFEPDCQSPRQMRLANALCRFRELASKLHETPTDTPGKPTPPCESAAVSMSHDHTPEIRNAVEQAEKGYWRLVLLVPDASMPRYAVLENLHRLGWPVCNLGLALAEELMNLSKRERAVKMNEILDQLVKDQGNVVCLTNLELLFEPSLASDPLKLLQGLSRNRVVVALWPGQWTGAKLTYADPAHRESRSYQKPDAVVVPLGT